MIMCTSLFLRMFYLIRIPHSFVPLFYCSLFVKVGLGSHVFKVVDMYIFLGNSSHCFFSFVRSFLLQKQILKASARGSDCAFLRK